jgi:hypothetical protein
MASNSTSDSTYASGRNGADTDTAAQKVVSVHLDMFRGSCCPMAVEACRIWNEFPDQRNSTAMFTALHHFGEPNCVLDDITVVMQRLLSAPCFDDAFMCEGLVAKNNQTSWFLRSCILASLILKYCESTIRYSDYNQCRQDNYRGCPDCKSSQMMRDLLAYIARRRLQSM